MLRCAQGSQLQGELALLIIFLPIPALNGFLFLLPTPGASLPLDKFCSSGGFLHQQCPAKLLADATGDSPGVSSHSRILRDTGTPPRWLLPLQQHLSPPVFVELSP